MIENIEIVKKPDPETKWTIYGAKWCKSCVKAKDLLESCNIKYTYHDLGNKESTSKVIEEFKKITDEYAYIPMIFNYDEFIGGFTDLEEMIKDEQVKFDIEDF